MDRRMVPQVYAPPELSAKTHMATKKPSMLRVQALGSVPPEIAAGINKSAFFRVRPDGTAILYMLNPVQGSKPFIAIRFDERQAQKLASRYRTVDSVNEEVSLLSASAADAGGEYKSDLLSLLVD